MDTETARIASDWFCERYTCWMTKSACDDRRIRAKSKRSDGASQKYALAGCGKCNQKTTIIRGAKENMEPQDIDKQVENTPQVKKEKACTGPCGRTIPMTAFKECAGQPDGRANVCKECRSALSRMSRRAVVERKKTGLPIAVNSGVRNKIDPRERQPKDKRTGILLDFSGYPDLFESLDELASSEFRTVEHQILYILHKQIGALSI